jgi:hypothetical protein
MIDRRIGPIYVRKGTDTERRLFVADEAEFVYSTDKKRLFIGDDTTKGGILVSNKNYITNSTDTITIPLYEAMYGDIIFNKMVGITYIIGYDLDGVTLKLIPICDLYICDKLKIKVDALSAKFDTIKDCLINYDIDNHRKKDIIFDTHGQLFFKQQPVSALEVFEGDSIKISCTVFDSLSVDPPYLPSRQFRETNEYINGVLKSKKGRLTSSVKRIPNSDLYTYTANINNARMNDSGKYELVYRQMYKVKSAVSNFNNLVQAITSEPITVLVKSRKDLPIFVTQPISQITTSLVAKSFSVSAVGTLPINYQWFKDNTKIAGANSITYTETNPTKTVTLMCQASNIGGIVDSMPAILQVGIKPFITKQPITQTVKIASTANISIGVDGSPTLEYQWFIGSITSKTIIIGATNPTLTITPVAKTDENTYFCEVKNDYGSVTSDIVSLKVVHPLVGTGEFLEPGTNKTWSVPDGITKIRVKVAGSGGPAVILDGGDVELIDASVVGIKLAGAKVTRGMAGTPASDMGDSGKISSGGAGLGAFKDNVFGFLAYSTSGGGGGGAVYFKVLMVKGGDKITYTTGIPKGESSVSINGWSASAGAGGAGLVGGFGRSTGTIVNKANTGFSYAGNPTGVPNGGSGGIITGGPVDFSFTGKNGGTPVYGGLDVRINGGDGGQNGFGEDYGGYIFIEYVDDSVTPTTPPTPNPAFPTTPPPATPATPVGPTTPPVIPFGDVSPFITTQPLASQTVNIGTPASISLVANGTAPLSYEWHKDGVVMAGKTTNTITFAATVATDAGIYKCKVSNKLGDATSTNSELIIKSSFTSTITTDSCTVDMIKVLTDAGWDGKESSLNGFTLNINANVGCCVNNSQRNVKTFNWGTLNVNNFLINIIVTNKSLVLGIKEVLPANITLNKSALYSKGGAVIKGNVGGTGFVIGTSCVISYPAPYIYVQPIASQTVNVGNPATISLSAEGTNPLSYEWHKDGVVMAGKTTNTLTFTSTVVADAGIYKCKVSNAIGNVTSTDSELRVKKPFDATTTVTKDSCSLDMIKILTDAGWDGKESSLNGFKVTISGKIGCCKGTSAPTTPTFNWGTLNVNNFLMDIIISGKAVLVLGNKEVVPANITITDDTYFATNDAILRGGLTFGGGTSTLGSCPAP